MAEKLKQNKYLVLLLIVGAVYFFLKYLSPLLAPVLVAVLFLTMFYPQMDDIQRKTRIKKQFLATGFVILFCVIVGILLWCICFVLMQNFPGWIRGLDNLQNQITVFVRGCCTGIENILGVDAFRIEQVIVERMNILIDDFQGNVLPQILDESLGYAKEVIEIGAFLAVTVIAVILLAKDYDAILDKIAMQKESRMAMEVVVGVIRYIATFIKAQAVIMLSIGVICVAVLSFAKIPQGAAWGILAGILDALPFIGTGIVLIPLALWQLFSGLYGKAAICLILYIGCAILREFLEPRLIGSKVGVYPVGILIAVYAGLKLFGLGGIFLGPIGLVIIQQVYKMVYRKEETVEEEGTG